MFIRQVRPIRPSPASPGLVISVAPRSTCRYVGDPPLMSSGRGGESEGKEKERGRRVKEGRKEGEMCMGELY